MTSPEKDSTWRVHTILHHSPPRDSELTIPCNHTFTKGSILVTDVVVNQFYLRYTLTIMLGLRLKGAATRPGQHPANIITVMLKLCCYHIAIV